MFTDVVGSTGLRTTFGDDLGDTVVAHHDEVVRAIVAAHGGYVVKGLGDGCLAVFPSAREAVVAALDIKGELMSREEPAGTDSGITIGINTGEVLETGGDVLGESVNAAARIAAVATAGEVLVSRVVRDVLGTVPGMELTSQGTFELKGFPEPWELYAVDRVDGTRDPPAGAVVEIQLLGDVVAKGPEGVIDGFASPRLHELVARLVFARGAPVARATLAFELWPDSDEAQARTNLRKALHELRSALPRADEIVRGDGGVVQWNTSGPARVDVLEVLDALDRHDHVRAVGGYAGRLLPSCYSDWVLEARELLQDRVVAALHELAEEAAARGDDEESLHRFRGVVRLDPLDEAAHRGVMRAHGRRGERAQALRAFHRCAEVLRRQLGVEPDAATVELYEVLRSGGAATADRSPTDRVVAVRSPTLVGRESEWESVTDAWSYVLAGSGPRFVLVTGEAGIGKSRLVADLARYVAAHGYAVARSRAYEAAGRFPWGPVIEWLRSDDVQRAVSGLDAATCGEIVRLLPELRIDAAELEPVPSLIDDTRRQRLLEAVVSVLTTVGRPLLLVLDDLQWCDPDTVEVLGLLARRPLQDPLLVAATARSDALPSSAVPMGILDALVRDGVVHELPLSRLDAQSTARLVERLVGHDVADDVHERLWRETEGNPLFIVEAVRSLLTGGPALTPTVQAAIRSRLAQLSDEARAVLDVAGTIGRSFSVEELAAAMGRDADELIDPLDELWRRQVVRDLGVDYDFTHDKLREVAQAEVSPVRRRRTHRAVAEGLVALYGEQPGSFSARLAHHYEEAGLRDEAVRAYEHAARHSVDVASYRDAVGLLHQALRLLEGGRSGPDRDQVELDLRIALATALVATAGYSGPETRDAYERALVVSRRSGRADPAALRGIGLADLLSGRFHSSLAYGEALLQQTDDPIAVTEGHYLVGVSSFWLGQLRRSERELGAAIESYRTDLTREHVARFAQDPKAVCLVRRGCTLAWLGEYQEALCLIGEAKAWAAAVGHPLTIMYVHVFSATMALMLEDDSQAFADVEVAERLIGNEELYYYTSMVRLLRASLEARQGDGTAVARLSEVIDTMHRTHQRASLSVGLLHLARALQAGGRLDEALEVIGEALGVTAEHDQNYLEPELHLARAQLLAERGDRPGALAAVERSIEVAIATEGRFSQERAESLRDELLAPA